MTDIQTEIPTIESATYRALICPAIIAEMIDQSSLPTDDHLFPKPDRPLLSTLALVCKAFNRPATKALWSRLDSFFPLLNILSGFDNKETIQNTEPTYLISDGIFRKPHEFSRFRQLGSFVRAVVPLPQDCVCEEDPIKPSVWFYLSLISGRKPLFPNLQELHWFVEGPSSTELLHVVSSSLRQLRVCYGGCGTSSREWSLSQSMLFRGIFNFAPRLTHLTISDTGADAGEALFAACLSNVGMLRDIRTIHLDEDEPVNVDIIYTLSSLKTLEDLSIGINYTDSINFTGFPALVKLKITGTPLSCASCQVFQAFSSPHLRNLHILHRDEAVDTDDILKMSITFTQCFPSLESLSLTVSSPLRGGARGVPLEDALNPLFYLPMVELSLEIQDSLVIGLSDYFFAKLAQSWCQLREISIVISQQRNDVLPSAVISTQTLLVLARGCPQLRTLKLPNMRFLDLGETTMYPVMRHPLRRLAAGCLFTMLPLGSPAVAHEDILTEFALMLDKLFPDLDAKKALFGVEPLSEPWKRILSRVWLCQLARSNRGAWREA